MLSFITRSSCPGVLLPLSKGNSWSKDVALLPAAASVAGEDSSFIPGWCSRGRSLAKQKGNTFSCSSVVMLMIISYMSSGGRECSHCWCTQDWFLCGWHNDGQCQPARGKTPETEHPTFLAQGNHRESRWGFCIQSCPPGSTHNLLL